MTEPAETFKLPGSIPITISEEADNEAVLDSVKYQAYPPTNPAVLLRAARWLYLQGRHSDAYAIVVWTKHLMQEVEETR